MTPKQYLHKIAKSVFQYQTPRLKKRGEELFPLLDDPEHKPHHGRIRAVIERLAIPPTSWLIDYIGLGKILAHRLQHKEHIDPRMLELLDDLEEIPSEDEQQRAIERERKLQVGDYDGLLRNPAKYEAQEQKIRNNPKLIEHWNRISELFKLGKFRHARTGVVRRTQYLERGVPPEEFQLEKARTEERWLFQAITDRFCKRYGLFGMRFNEPLVEKLTVTRTPFTTNVSIPRWMNIAKEDLLWEAFLDTHWDPDLKKQGAKASLNELDRIEMLRRIDTATIQTKSEGLKGEPGRRRIEELAKLPAHTDKRVHIRWQNEIKELKKKGML